MAKKASDEARKSINEVNQELSYLEDQLISVADSLSNTIKNAIQDIREESAGVGEIFEKNLSRSIKDIARESDKILSNTLKLAKGEAKISDIKRSELNLQLKQLSTQRNLNNLYSNGLISAEDKAEAEADIQESIAKQNVLLKDQLALANQIQRNMGLTGKLLKSMSKIPILGDLIDAERALAAAQLEAAQEGSNRIKVMKAGFSSLGKSLKENLTDPLVMTGVLMKTIQTLVSIGTDFSQRTADTARSMGISNKAAKEMLTYFRDISMNSNFQVGTAKDLAAANERLNNLMGTQVGYSAEILTDQVELQKKAGLSNEELERMAEFSFLTGKSQEDIYDSVNAQGKKIFSNRKILQETLKISGRLTANYKNNPIALGQAVAKAHELGMTLEQTRKTSDGLLNFEQSISDELNAELLTGKDLNLEKARELALYGKTAEAAEEVVRQVGGLSEFQKLNVIQQEALAKITGQTVDEFVDQLAKRQEIQNIQQQELGLTGKILTDEEAATKLRDQQLSASERMAETLAQVKESLAAMLEGPLSTIIEKVSGALTALNESPAAKYILKYAGGLGAVVALGGSILMMAQSVLRGLTGVQKVYVVNAGEMGGGSAGQSIADAATSLPGRGTKMGGVFKTLSKLAGGKNTMVGRGLRNLASTALKRGGLAGQISKRLPGLSRMLPGASKAASAGSKLGIGAAGKLLAPATALLQTGKGLYDFASDERNRATGVGGFLENLGGTGMHILDTATFGLTKLATNAAGVSIPGIDTDDVASARAIFHASGRDPDDSRFPIGTDNKQLVNDILNNPSAYPEGIVEQAQGVDISKLAVGGIVRRPTNALVGESGPEAVIPLSQLYAKFDELIAAYKMGSNVYLDSTKVGQSLAMANFKTQ
jgi:hypothetical protein